MGRVLIIIVNWNGWKDTLECLESVFRNCYTNYQVVVCDNASSDNSVERIKQWARGETAFKVIEESKLGRLSRPPIPKPVPFIEYDQETAEVGGDLSSEAPLVLVGCNKNLGFAGGNNVALRYMQARGEFEYSWLLNNDTVIEPDALAALVQRMKECPDAGMCGSLMPYYDQPERLWAQGGGTFNRWLAKPKCLGNNLSIKEKLSADYVERRMAYVAGASLLVSRGFIETVGLLCEDYFLYFEEPDWAFRGRDHYSMAYAAESIVYHKVGRSTQWISRTDHNVRSSYDYVYRNSLRFTFRFFPVALPLAFLWCGGRLVLIKGVILLRKLWRER